MVRTSHVVDRLPRGRGDSASWTMDGERVPSLERALRDGDCTFHAKSEPREGTAVIGAAAGAGATIVSVSCLSGIY